MRTQAVLRRTAEGVMELVRLPRRHSTHSQRQQIRRMADQVRLDVAQLPLPPWCEGIADLSFEDARWMMDGLGHLRWAGGPIMTDRQRCVMESQCRRLGWTRRELGRFARAIVGAFSVEFLTVTEARRLIRVLLKVPHRKSPVEASGQTRGNKRRSKAAADAQEVAR